MTCSQQIEYQTHFKAPVTVDDCDGFWNWLAWDVLTSVFLFLPKLQKKKLIKLLCMHYEL